MVQSRARNGGWWMEDGGWQREKWLKNRAKMSRKYALRRLKGTFGLLGRHFWCAWMALLLRKDGTLADQKCHPS